MDHSPVDEPIPNQMNSNPLAESVQSYHRHTLHFDETIRDITWKSRQGPTWVNQYTGNPTPYTTLDSQSNPMNPFNNPTHTQHATNAVEIYEAADEIQDLFRVQSTLADEGLVGITYLWKWVKRMLVLPYWQKRVCVSFASDIPSGDLEWYTIGISISEDEVTLCVKDRIWAIDIGRLLAADLEDISPFASISSLAIVSDTDTDTDTDTESASPNVIFTAMAPSSPASSTHSSLSSLSLRSSILSIASEIPIVMSPTPPPQVPASPSVYIPSLSSSRSVSPSYMSTPPTSGAHRPEPVSRFKARRDRMSSSSSISSGTSVDQVDDKSQGSPVGSPAQSEIEILWQPYTKSRKRHSIQRSARIDSPRRKRHKRDPIGLVSRKHSSATASSSLVTPLLCSNCSALLPPTLPTSYLDQESMRLLPRQPDLGRYTPFSEVSSDIKGSTIPTEVYHGDKRRRRSRSSVLEDLVPVSIKTRSTIRISTMREKRQTHKSLSAIHKFVAELNSEEQPPASEPESESSIESDQIIWDESQSPSTQSLRGEYHSPINARTRRSTRRSSADSEQRPTNDLLSSLLDFMNDLNDSEDILLESEAGTVAG